MHNCVLYRQTRRNNSMLLPMERDFLCVCTQETSALVKDNKFSEYFAAVPVVSRFAVPKLYWLPIKAIKYRLSQSLFTIRNITFGRLSKILTNMALRPWGQNHDRAGRMNLLKTTRHLLQKQLNALQTCWVALLNVGLWKNLESISSEKKSFLRSALKRFEASCMTKRSSFDGSKHGKNATIRSLSLKKTDSQICKPALIQWPDDLIRRIRPTGDSSSAGTSLLSYGSPEKTSCNVYTPTWCSALAGFLRCAQEKAVGLCSFSQAASGIPRSIKAFKEEVSEKSANPFDPGQLLTPSQGKGIAVLSKEQYSPDLDTDQCFMAESYRMSVYPCQGIRDSWNQLSKPSGTPKFLE